MHKNLCIASFAATAAMLASSSTFANGFSINEQSVKGMGQSYAGRSSSAQDATTVFGNPAGMSKLERETFSLGLSVAVPVVDVSNPKASNSFGAVSGTVNDDITPPAFIPSNYYVKPLNEKWAFGMGIYSPFGLGTDYDHDSSVRYVADKSEILMVNLQPTLSYRVTDDFSIGVGIIASYLQGNFSSALPITDGKLVSKGNDVGYGYNIGLLYQVTNQTRIGLTYHSMIRYDLDMKTKVRGLSPLLGPENFDIHGTLSIATPEVIDASITHQLDDQWTIYAGSSWTRWDRWGAITISNKDSAAPIFDESSQVLGWKNSWSHAIGVSYDISPKWTLRAGYARDESPVNNSANARVPIADRNILSMGATMKLSDNLTVDFAYSYLHQDSFTLKQQDESGNVYQARYRASAHGFGTQLNYQF